ncbi:MAG TPA: response regulator [Candidatus Limnocylindria bacterium]|nr:response regulator [Candidatus Limnocylindria bacterium]
MGVVTLIAEVLFGFLFIATLVSYVRRRDALSRDVMLIFATVAALFAVIGISVVFGRLPDFVLGAAILLLLAQPLLILRMAHRLRPVPWLLRAASVSAFVLTGAPFLVLPLAQLGPLFVPAAITYVAIDLVAAWFLIGEAARRVGSARIRLGAASAGSAAMALALGLIASQLPVATEIGRILILGAATLFVLGFMPPAWVRKVWNAVATYEFTEELSAAPPSREDAALVWSRAADISRRLTGATVALVVTGNPPQTRAVSGDEQLTAGIGAEPLSSLPPAGEARPADDGDELATLARSLDARYVSVVPFSPGGAEPGAMVLFRPYPSLFAADDHAIIQAIVSRAAVFAERNVALVEQAALSDRLALTVQALEQASKAKSDFLASMSHELRTPLSAIIGFSALMGQEPLEDASRRVPDEWVAHIHNSGEHLLALINDVLDLTKIEAGRIELQREPFDLAQALTESVEGLRPLAERKQIAMTVDAPEGALSADRGRLRQMLYNLLSNAIKFTPEGGAIRVEAAWDDDDAHVAVVDSGVGIAQEDLERIFQEFSQVGDLKAREAGTGLGLALTRRLAEAHGGSVAVSSTPGEGSRFELLLPASRVMLEKPAEVVLPEASSALATVLVIEDDPGAVRLLQAYLGGAGYEVMVATDGVRGIAAATSVRPSAIILDVLLPGIDGWEVLRRLKADEATRDIPVIVATVVDERNVAMSLGAVDYFLKPVRPQALLARLSQYTFTTKVKQRPVRVLAVDDDPAARQLILNALEPEGFDVVAAASGREAIELAEAQPPELVICDLVMPDMDGFEVVSRLHANEATRDATILILTGQELTTADRERLNGKVAEILTKGEDPRAAFAKWLNRAAAAAARRAPRVEGGATA